MHRKERIKKKTKIVWMLDIRCLCLAALLFMLVGWYVPVLAEDLSDLSPTFSNYPDNKAAAAAAILSGGSPAGFRYYGSFDAGGNAVPGAYVINGPNGKHNQALATICAQSGYLTERIVNCVSTNVDTAVTFFMARFRPQMLGFLSASTILAIIFFANKLLMGNLKHEPRSEIIMFVIKIGLVWIFSTNPEAINMSFGKVFDIMETFAGYALAFLDSPHLSPFMHSCGLAGGLDASIWAKVDCILSRLFTGGELSDGSGQRVGVLWILTVAMMWTPFLGIFAAIIMVIVFISICLLVMRTVFVFLSAYMMLGFVCALSPLLIPLALFERTMSIVNAVINLVISLIIQPMVVFLAAVFFLAMLDAMLFQDNPYSLSRILGYNWETPQFRPPLSPEDLDKKMQEFVDITAYPAGSPEYLAQKNYLQTHQEYAAIGDSTTVPSKAVGIADEQLLNIEINPTQDLVESSFLGDSIYHILNAISPALSSGVLIAELGTKVVVQKLEKMLVPFQVPRIQPVDPTISRDELMWQLTKFFLTLLVLMPIMVKFIYDLPSLVEQLTNMGMQGRFLPGEKQVHGVLGALRAAEQGVKQGAIKGAAKGGKKGAIKGAVVEGGKAAVKGYQEGSRKGFISSN